MTTIITPSNVSPLTPSFSPMVPRNNLMAFIGDSITRGPTIANVFNYVVWLPIGTQAWVPFLTRQRVRSEPYLNFGVDGDTTSGVLARLPGILASNAGVYKLQIGTNDFSLGFAYALTQSNMLQIVAQLAASQSLVIVSTVWPRSGSAALSTQYQAYFYQLNTWIKTLPSLFNGVFVVDPCNVFGDGSIPVLTAKTNYTHDGLHPTELGSYWASQPDVALINELFGDQNEQSWSGGEVYDAVNNPHGNLLNYGGATFSPITTSGGTVDSPVTGTTGFGWTIGAGDFGGGSLSGLACATSVVTRTLPNGYDTVLMQELNFAGSTACTPSQFAEVFCQYGGTFGAGLGNFSAGDTIYSTLDVEWDTNIAGISAVYQEVAIVANGVTYTMDGMNPIFGQYALPTPNATVSGTCRTPQFTIPPGTISSVTFFILVQFFYNGGGNVTPAGKCRFGNPSLRKM